MYCEVIYDITKSKQFEEAQKRPARPGTKRSLLTELFVVFFAPLFSFLGPIYFGIYDRPYVQVFVWAVACAPVALWLYRKELVSALRGYSFPIQVINFILIILTVAGTIIAGHSIVYFLARFAISAL